MEYFKLNLDAELTARIRGDFKLTKMSKDFANLLVSISYNSEKYFKVHALAREIDNYLSIIHSGGREHCKFTGAFENNGFNISGDTVNYSVHKIYRDEDGALSFDPREKIENLIKELGFDLKNIPYDSYSADYGTFCEVWENEELYYFIKHHEYNSGIGIWLSCKHNNKIDLIKNLGV